MQKVSLTSYTIHTAHNEKSKLISQEKHNRFWQKNLIKHFFQENV